MVNSKIALKRAIYNIFTKKHGLHIQTGATRYLESYLENDPDYNDSMEKIIQAYRKRYNEERLVVVTEDAIKQVVSSLQSSAAIANAFTPFQRVNVQEEEEINDSMQEMSIDEPNEIIDVTQHFHVVSAFDLPNLIYDEHSRMFNKKERPSLLANARQKGDMYRERFKLVRQRLLRNEAFCPPSMRLSDDENFVKITPIKSLIGCDNQDFLLFGMLTQLEDGKIHLEDLDANIELVLNDAVVDFGLYTDGTFVLVNGRYGDDHRFHVREVDSPPVEPREMTDVLFRHVDFWGLPKPLVDERLLKQAEAENDHIIFVILSDVHLDQPKVMNALRVLFESYSGEALPLAFILIGNFSSKPFVYSGSEKYKDNFSALADLIGEYHDLATHTNFVFVPGPKDPWAGKSLPQSPISPSFVSRMKQKVRKVTFATNPCRIRYCTQDIVIFREDWLQKLSRNTLLATNLEKERDRIVHFIHTIADQGHLSPLPLSIKPVEWAYDNALRLYPLPHAVIVADSCEEYGINYEGTEFCNPGSFPNSDFTWRVYRPSQHESERSQIQ